MLERISKGLTSDEVQFYDHLLSQARGRPEQEFLPQTAVHQTVAEWAEGGAALGWAGSL